MAASRSVARALSANSYFDRRSRSSSRVMSSACSRRSSARSVSARLAMAASSDCSCRPQSAVPACSAVRPTHPFCGSVRELAERPQGFLSGGNRSGPSCARHGPRSHRRGACGREVDEALVPFLPLHFDLSCFLPPPEQDLGGVKWRTVVECLGENDMQLGTASMKDFRSACMESTR